MRILYVLPSLLIGGAESLVCQWSSCLHQDGHKVEVCTLYTEGPFARQLKEQGIQIHNLQHDSGIEQYRLRRKYDPRLAASLLGVIRRGDYQIVHSHLFPSLLYMAFLSYLDPRPAYLYSEHSTQNRRRRHAAMKMVDRFLYSRSRLILAVSEGVRSSLCQWLPELSHKIQVVPNTANISMPDSMDRATSTMRKTLGIEKDERVVLYAGRLIPDKGADILIEAAARLAQLSVPPVHILLAGEGPLRAQLQARGSLLSRPVRVTLLGNREDIPRLLELADLVVIPSRWEGLPMFLLESMAAGKAILAAEVGGIPEAIQHNFSGWLVPPEDPTALAQSIAALLPQENMCIKLGENARQAFTSKYSPQSAIQKLLQVYGSFQPEVEISPQLSI